MDPLSVAASMIAVAGALYTVSQKLRNCAATLAHAGKEIIALAKEMDTFSTLLRSLQCTIEHLVPRLPRAFDDTKMCNDLVSQAQENVDEFDRFLDSLKPLRDTKDTNVFAKTLARLRWAFQKTDLLLLRSKLESSKSTINMYLSSIILRFVEAQMAAIERGERNRAKLRGLKRQVKLLKSQLRNQRTTVKDAIAASRHLELLIRGEQRSSVVQAVAEEALRLAKRQLGEYARQTVEERRRRQGIHPRSLDIPPTTSDNSSPRPGPVGPPSPPPSPPLARTPASQHVPPFSTLDTDRRMGTGVVGAGASALPGSEGAASNVGVRLPFPATRPAATEINTGIRDRSARTLDPRTGGESRVIDQDGNVVWTERYHDNE